MPSGEVLHPHRHNLARYSKPAAAALESQGHSVRIASDAAQAAEQIINRRPDLILMGSSLRGMDGMTLAMHLKAEPATRDIRIVAWSASAANRAAEIAAASGCDGYITKLLDGSSLADEVAHFLFDAASAREGGAIQPDGLKILVVDDNILGREILAALLSTEGHIVIEATDGVQAMAILQEEPVNAVISDLMMPGMDGYQLCHKIRGDARLSGMPVIIYSGTFTSQDSETLASNLGAIRFLRKPTPLETIIATLREALSESESRRVDAPGAETPAIDFHSSEKERRLIEQLAAQGRNFQAVTDHLLQTHHQLLVLAHRLGRSEENLREKNSRLEEDLQMARETHLALLPRSYPSLPRGAAPEESAFRFHQCFAPKGAVSGDFFDVPALSDTKVGVFICDVMGHGVCAALVTALIRGVLGRLAPMVSDPGEVLGEINRTLAQILWQAGAPAFASAFYMTADTASGEIRYANAGHPSPLLLRRETGAVERLGIDAHGPVLGLLSESRYQTGRQILAPRDLVLLFTDGIFEVDGPDEEPFGQERLLEAVRSRIGLPLAQLVGELLDEVRRFSLIDGFEDDVCLLGMEVHHLCASSQLGSEIRSENSHEDQSHGFLP